MLTYCTAGASGIHCRAAQGDGKGEGEGEGDEGERFPLLQGVVWGAG